MITEKDIDGFYQQVKQLGLKFPVAAISKATGYSKGNVSDYLKRNKTPSENFLKVFNAKFLNSSTPGSFVDELGPVLVQLMKTQNEILAEQKTLLKERVTGLESNLNSVLQNQQEIMAIQKAGHDVLLEIVAPLGKLKPDQAKNTLRSKANGNLEKMRAANKLAGVGK